MSTERILIFRTGSLGDTLASVPAMSALREHYRSSRLDLLCDRQAGKSYVQARDVLEGSQLVDDFLFYPVDPSRLTRILRPFRMFRLLMELRQRRYHKLVYLRQSQRKAKQVKRDLRFFILLVFVRLSERRFSMICLKESRGILCHTSSRGRHASEHAASFWCADT